MLLSLRVFLLCPFPVFLCSRLSVLQTEGLSRGISKLHTEADKLEEKLSRAKQAAEQSK